MHCSFCINRDVRKTNDMSLKTFKSALNNDFHIFLAITGGECFLHPQIRQFLRIARKKRGFRQITTNGSILKPFLDDLKGFSLAISIDGIGEEHDNIRGKKGLFSRIMDNIELLKQHGIKFLIFSTIGEWNLDQLESLINFTKTNGYKIGFQPAIPAKEEIVKTIGKIGLKNYNSGIIVNSPSYLRMMAEYRTPNITNCHVDKIQFYLPDGSLMRPCSLMYFGNSCKDCFVFCIHQKNFILRDIFHFSKASAIWFKYEIKEYSTKYES